MTAGRERTGIRPDQLLGALLRASVPISVAAATATAVIYAVVVGLGAALAVFLGLAVTLVFFGLDLVVFASCRGRPGSVLAAALLGEYAIKMVVFATLLWALNDSTAIDLHALSVGVIVSVVALVAAVTRAAITTRSFYFDFGPSDTMPTSRDDDASST